MLHSDLVRQALDQLGTPLAQAPSCPRLQRAYCQMIRGLSLHAAGNYSLSYMALSRFVATGPLMPIEDDLAAFSSKHFYWRTAILSLYLKAKQNHESPLFGIGWLKEEDIILYSAIKQFKYESVVLDSFRLSHHFNLELMHGKALRFEGLEDALQRTKYEREVAKHIRATTPQEPAEAPLQPAIEKPAERPSLFSRLRSTFKTKS